MLSTMFLQILALVYLKLSLNLEGILKIFLITPHLIRLYLSHDEVRKLVSQLNNRKALGPTSILVTIRKDNIDVLVRPLSLVLNQSFEQGILPEVLKIAQVLPIHKKEDIVTISNYRPISLLSVFSKIFEKAMYYRIYSFF